MLSRRRLAVALVVLLVAVAVAAVALAVTRGANSSGTSRAPTGAGTASEPGASATRTAVPVMSPLTGRPAPAGRGVLAVKIDNVRPARPQTGLGSADVVYVEPVEGGLSRIMAIFSSTLPDRVGPVRSARESDLELLAQYGRPGLAYSGANRAVLAAIRSAPVADLSPDRVPSAYRRAGPHIAPHNLYADPKTLLERGQQISQQISVAKSIGFRFGDLPAGEGTSAGGKVTARRAVKYGAATTAFSWSSSQKRWNVSLDGRPATTTDGERLGAATVVIQYTKITSSDLHDVLGNPTPYTHSVGSGKAVVLRDGVAIQAQWSRPTAEAGTTFTTATGEALPFAAGQVWVVFAKG